MSPLTHAMIGWLAGHRLASKRDRMLVVAAGVIPDLDGLGILVDDLFYDRYHHVLSHNLLAALAAAALCAAFGRERAWTAGLGFLSFHLHLFCDQLGSGPGWGMSYLWPASDWYYLWPGQWDLGSWQNGLVTAGAMAAILFVGARQGRTFFEVFSTRFDAHVVALARKWRQALGG